MKKETIFVIYSLLLSVALLLLIGCADEDVIGNETLPADARELQGIEAVIDNGTGVTRAGTITPLADYVGRSDFKSGDMVMFTEIRRTSNPILNFTYPDANYEGICFKVGSEGGWKREIKEVANEPERVYWTDAVSNHKFVAYGKPQTSDYDWKTYQFTQESTRKTYYIGSLGNPTVTTVHVGDTDKKDSIDYSLTPEEQATYTVKENNKTVYKNPKLENEDLVIAYDDKMMAEPGGSVALVKFHHALSSIRVVVNISGFSSSSSAADTNTVVSNMRLLHQPTMYIWEQSGWGAQPMRATAREGVSATDQQMINFAWTGSLTGNGPAYNQRKDIKLWIPRPEGAGLNQSKTFTFYGITTPQPQNYISTLAVNDSCRKVELKFDVTYPNPLKPSTTKTHTYTASLQDVYFEAGYNTTINISLNHRNEQMTVGAEYENWQFVATPDQGLLKKNSTFLQDTARASVTIVGDEKATIDDATWLYATTVEGQEVIYDIYGHTGTASDPYQISTAYQLLSFAHEVKSGNNGAGRDFAGKYIRLDADITLQSTSDKTRAELDSLVDGEVSELYTKASKAIDWIGIGDADHAFNGTFLGGKRFIYRLKGSPLFHSLGASAKIEQLQVNTVHKPDGSTPAVTGSGMYANTNAGLICACKVVGDVAFDASMAGAFVGQNTTTGKIFACYHIGLTKSTATTASVGGLAGSNSGIISSCYHSGEVKGTTRGGIVAANTGTLYNNYFNSNLLSPNYTPDIPDGSTTNGVTGKTASEMTRQAFVTEMNDGISTWRTNNSGYDNHVYVYQPANYPILN